MKYDNRAIPALYKIGHERTLANGARITFAGYDTSSSLFAPFAPFGPGMEPEIRLPDADVLIAWTVYQALSNPLGTVAYATYSRRAMHATMDDFMLFLAEQGIRGQMSHCDNLLRLNDGGRIKFFDIYNGTNQRLGGYVYSDAAVHGLSCLDTDIAREFKMLIGLRCRQQKTNGEPNQIAYAD